MNPRVVEASAPCRVDLGGGEPGTPEVAVAIDRRVACRVEAGPGIGEPTGLAGHVRRALGLEVGARVVTESRLPEGSGLGDETAFAVALAGAFATAIDRPLSAEAIVRLAEAAIREAGMRADTLAAGAAVRGGAVLAGPGGEAPVEPLGVDPARIEECLTLVDAGAGSSEPPATRVSRDVRAAIVGGRLEDVVGLWAEEWDERDRLRAGWASPEAARLSALVRAAGGAVRPCGGGLGRVLAVWAPPGARGPGRREAVHAALRSAGVRLFAARVDLRGLEVE